ncbi:hypothetical protein [Oxynema aestuarii]|uniref:Uncharacterized protein n=1 Tax=Oxynema aestuarii AP17 TaxID=2064643 RepID=A0A6H1TT73_9CYAN|nr:hypothetical protein [Oxynema aestuarii]QIZ69160.1 hypothetical protein HCG48_13790 [Oxynema aestuarii AP17]
MEVRQGEESASLIYCRESSPILEAIAARLALEWLPTNLPPKLTRSRWRRSGGVLPFARELSYCFMIARVLDYLENNQQSPGG